MDDHLVLVLGAGASYSYGFPLGRELVFKISSELQSTGDPQTALIRLDHGREELRQFCNALVDSNLSSVDQFLEVRQEYETLGKRAIAACLIPCEDDRKLRRNHRSQHFYEVLFSKLFTADKSKFPARRISIITFNYDRSLERSLELSLANSYGCSATELLERIKIVHMYGQLGSLTSALEFNRLYKPGLDASTVSKAADCIQIISGIRETSPAIEEAKEIIRSASQIAFLGFGYNVENVRRLGFPLPETTPWIFGTCMGMTKTERSQAGAIFNHKNGSITFFEEDADCLMGLRHLEW